ncbi:MAG: hypothetical protein AAFR64_11700 [Pseudomonadota bacterium]
MEKAEFEAQFDETVTKRLVQLGFNQNGRSLSFLNEHTTLTLFRLGGRMSRPGCISLLLCFRHSFLRDLEGYVTTTTPLNIFDYPYKFRPLKDRHLPLAYRPQNLNYEYERIRWEGVDKSVVLSALDRLSTNIKDHFFPWSQSISAKEAMSEIEKRGENAWCEGKWIEDYVSHVGLW